MMRPRVAVKRLPHLRKPSRQKRRSRKPKNPQASDPAASLDKPPRPESRRTVSGADHPIGRRVFSSPLARRIAKDAGVDVAQISGSGPHGRVVKKDVEAAIAAGTGKAPASEAAPQAAASAATGAAPKGMSDDAVLKNFRRRLLRAGQARRHAQDHRPPSAGIQADDPAFLRHRGLRTRCAAEARSELNKAAPLKDDKPPTSSRSTTW
jgi:pyruvate dehydrogenase E2 component (dihydrolipoamide acetyltransferase)